MTTTALFTEAKKLIMSGWTQGSLARDLNGGRVSCLSNEATNFDLFGALIRARVNLNLPLEDFAQARAQVITAISTVTNNLTVFNDYGTKEEVLELLDKLV